MQKAELGNKASKLKKVEIHVSIDFVRLMEAKSGVFKYFMDSFFLFWHFTQIYNTKKIF